MYNIKLDTNMKKLLIVISAMLLSVGVLLISMSRASLEIMAKDEREGKLRVDPVIVKDQVVYMLPQTNMLPDNPLYAIKEMRGWLWQKFSENGNEKEIKIVLVLADKKIAEAKKLTNKGKYDLALETSIEALNKLKYAKDLAVEIPKQSPGQKQLRTQIKEAAMAYEEIIRQIGQCEGIDDQKYSLLQQDINEFKEKQIQEEKTS